MSSDSFNGGTVHTDVGHLRDDQLDLVRTVLRAGGVESEVKRNQLVTNAHDEGEVRAAMAWVLAAHGPAPDEFAFDDVDPDLVTGRGPLVQPPRPPLADGRRQATRWRRLAAGTIDEVVLGTPLILAAMAGANVWTMLAVSLVYRALPVATYGWTFGKLLLGTRVVDRRTLRTPNVLACLARWFVASVPLMIGLAVGAVDEAMTILATAIYAPILWNLRGLHDYASHTLVADNRRVR